MESVSFLSLCKVAALSLFDRMMAKSTREPVITVNEERHSLEASSFTVPSCHDGRKDDRWKSAGTKSAGRECFEPLDLAIHTDD